MKNRINGHLEIKQTEIDEHEYEKAIDNSGLNAQNATIPAVYKEVFLNNYKRFLLSSGRISGKTSILVVLWWITVNQYPDNDIVFLQATTTEIKNSVIVEIEKFLVNSGFDVGPNTYNEWYIPKSHTVIEHRGAQGKTHFFAITDTHGGQRTRGITTGAKLALVLYEEAQKNTNADVVEHSIATFIRQLIDNGKIVVVGNNETIGHWFIDYVNSKRQDPDWCYIYANCYDIWELLSSETKRYLDNFKKTNPIDFKRMYLGDIYATTSDVVFPQFNRDKHYLKANQLKKQYIRTVIVGVDHATTNDTFAIVPVAILEDGTTQTLEVCYDDPQETQTTLSPVEQCDILDDFLNFLDNKYGLEANRVQTLISIDGASAPFRTQVLHTQRTAKNQRLWGWVKVKSFTKKKKELDLDIIRNAFAYGVLTILDEGLYDWVGQTNKHRLVKEIEKLRYRNGKLDPKIPNDLCDALEYALVPYYTNCYNVSFPVRKQALETTAHYNDILAVINPNLLKRGNNYATRTK